MVSMVIDCSCHRVSRGYRNKGSREQRRQERNLHSGYRYFASDNLIPNSRQVVLGIRRFDRRLGVLIAKEIQGFRVREFQHDISTQP
jgi:hypothetical protein